MYTAEIDDTSTVVQKEMETNEKRIPQRQKSNG